MHLPEPLDTTPCAACRTGACCFAYRVVITPADVHRLCRGIDRSPLEFAFLLPSDTGTLRLGPGGPNHDICLQKRQGGPAGDPCCLLEPGDGCFRCSAHGARPMVCRSFPLRPTVAGTYVAGNTVCPPGWEAGHVRAPEAARLHGLWEIERTLDAAFAERWNRIADAAPPGRSRTPRMLFYWVIDVFDQLHAVLAPWWATAAGQDTLIARWPSGPWSAGVEHALGRLDTALQIAIARDGAR